MSIRVAHVVLASAVAVLSSCAAEPVSVERAMAMCESQAREAAAPVKSLEIGANSDGNVSTSVSIGLSAAYLAGRNPDEVFENCVIARSGEEPTRLYSELTK